MDHLQASFRALADPTRRQILTLLAHEEMSIAQVSARFAMTRAAVKKHLSVLEEGALVQSEPRGRERINRLDPSGLAQAASWLSHFDDFSDERLLHLKTAVETDTNDRTRKGGSRG